MSKATNKLHGLIGDYLRTIDSMKKKAEKENRNLSKRDAIFIGSLRKKIVEISTKLQKGW